MNLPNKLTLLRFLLVPVFMVCASFRFEPGWTLAAGIVFALASFTDFLDGYLARRNHMVTDFGKFADPLADKLLTTTAFIYMMTLNACHPVVLVIILAREFAVSGLRMVAAGAPGGKVIAANLWGKVKTVLQMVTVLVFYFGLAAETAAGAGGQSAYRSQAVGWALCWVVAAVTLLSGAKYLWDNRSFINTAK